MAIITSFVATEGSAWQACSKLTNFNQHSKQNTLCCSAQISPRLHLSNDVPPYLNMKDFPQIAPQQ